MTSAVVTPPSYDLRVVFDQKYVLTVFCDQVEPDLDNYSVWIGDVDYEVAGGSVLSVYGKDDPRWRNASSSPL